jgi:quercetin dioxygenase-like cupin family protein
MKRVTVLIGVLVMVGLIIVGGAGTLSWDGPRPAAAQTPEGPVPVEKGVKTKNLVTSLGGFRGTGSVPIVLTGQVVEIEPGGQTGRQRHLVPSYIYVLEGNLTTNSDGGPIGTSGVQYHAAGQSYMDAPGVWHNHSNSGTVPVKYLLLLISTPSGPLTEKAKGDD